MAEIMQKYTLKTIHKSSQHDAVSYLDDDEMLIVENEAGQWWPATEFFFQLPVTEFFAQTEEG